MTDEQLQRLVQSALPRVGDTAMRSDLWPAVAARVAARPRWSLVDTALVAAIATALSIFPQWFVLLALHL
jgi:hypothetical protein